MSSITVPNLKFEIDFVDKNDKFKTGEPSYLKFPLSVEDKSNQTIIQNATVNDVGKLELFETLLSSDLAALENSLININLLQGQVEKKIISVRSDNAKQIVSFLGITSVNVNTNTPNVLVPINTDSLTLEQIDGIERNLDDQLKKFNQLELPIIPKSLLDKELSTFRDNLLALKNNPTFGTELQKLLDARDRLAIEGDSIGPRRAAVTESLKNTLSKLGNFRPLLPSEILFINTH